MKPGTIFVAIVCAITVWMIGVCIQRVAEANMIEDAWHHLSGHEEDPPEPAEPDPCPVRTPH